MSQRVRVEYRYVAEPRSLGSSVEVVTYEEIVIRKGDQRIVLAGDEIKDLKKAIIEARA